MIAAKQIPNNIRDAVNSLLQPYGCSLDELLQNSLSSSTSTPKYLTVPQAENYTGLSRFSLIRAANSGKIISYKLSQAKSGKVLYDKDSIDAWIQSCRTPSIP